MLKHVRCGVRNAGAADACAVRCLQLGVRILAIKETHFSGAVHARAERPYGLTVPVVHRGGRISDEGQYVEHMRILAVATVLYYTIQCFT